MLNVATSKIRLYEVYFRLSATRSVKNHRRYSQSDIDRLRLLFEATDLGLSIEAARGYFNEGIPRLTEVVECLRKKDGGVMRSLKKPV